MAATVASMASICSNPRQDKTRQQDDKTTSRQDDKTMAGKHGSMSCAATAAVQPKKWVWFGSGLQSKWPAYSIYVCSINLASKNVATSTKIGPL